MFDLALLQLCAPGVAPQTMEAIIRTESGFNTLALHVNGEYRLRGAPRTASEAAAWSAWLIRQGYSVDMGLMQINSRNLDALGMTAADAFDPCQNLRAGARILTANYFKAAQFSGTGTTALLEAISAYNTGNFRGGFRNGYVARVVSNSHGRGAPAVASVSAGPSAAPLRLRPAPEATSEVCWLDSCVITRKSRIILWLVCLGAPIVAFIGYRLRVYERCRDVIELARQVLQVVQGAVAGVLRYMRRNRLPSDGQHSSC